MWRAAFFAYFLELQQESKSDSKDAVWNLEWIPVCTAHVFLLVHIDTRVRNEAGINRTSILILSNQSKTPSRQSPCFWPSLAFMFANYFWDFAGQYTCGRRAGCKLSHRVLGAYYDDLLNRINNWLKNIVASGFFWVTLFLAVVEKVTGSKGFETKTVMDASKRQRMFQCNKRPSIWRSVKSSKLVNHTSMMTGTQTRRPCRVVQLGEALLLKNLDSPRFSLSNTKKN